MTRDEIIGFVIGLEGGYNDTVGDAGGETKYGISKRAYPNETIPYLTMERAIELYQRDYWPHAQPVFEIAPGLGLMVYDTVVNMGKSAAIRLLQGAVGTKQDGILGPMTMSALEDKVRDGDGELVAEYAALRALRYSSLGNWHRFGTGWMRRLMTVTVKAVTA